MNNTSVYLGSYTLQSDSRIRLPKSAITNLNAVPGETRFSFYYDVVNNTIIMRICQPEKKQWPLQVMMTGRVKKMVDYRKEILDVSSFPVEECLKLVNAFNKNFPKKDAYMFLNEGITSYHA